MNKIILRLAVLTIITSCFVNSSCRKNDGFLAEYSINEPYYKDFVFEEQWTTDTTIMDFPGSIYFPALKLVNEDLLVCYDYELGIYAVIVQTGQIVWHTKADNYNFGLDTELLVTDELLVFYDGLGFTLVDLITGEVLIELEYNQIGNLSGNPRIITSHDGHILVMTIQGHSGIGTQRLYKINPLASEVLLLAEVETTVTYSWPETGHIFIDEDKNKVFFLYGREDAQDPILMLAEVNLHDMVLETHELGRNEILGRKTILFPFSVFNNVAFLASQELNSLVVHDLELETVVSVIPGPLQIEVYDSKLLTIRGRLSLLNPNTFQNEWRELGAGTGPIDFFDLKDGRQVLVVIWDSTASLFDLYNGQLLVRQPLSNFSINRFVPNIAVSRKYNYIITAGYDHNKSRAFIRSVKSPIDL